jgi:hypothetical protein
MQLAIRRSQREAGILSKNVVFCLDARVEFTAPEQASLSRYRLWSECIYNSEASKRLLDRSVALQDGSVAGGLKSLATAAMAALKLNITIGSLASGQHVECRTMDELLGAEEAILTACQNLKSYIDTAASFDGGQVLYDFSTDEPQIIAHAVTPDPQLVAPEALPPLPPLPPAAPMLPEPGYAAEPAADHSFEPYAAEGTYDADSDTGYVPAKGFSLDNVDLRPLIAVVAVFIVIIAIIGSR